MELRTLKYFLAVAREESITRAAEKIPLTQPALTRAIQSLEEEFGKKFFTREKYSVKLTTDGLEFLQDAQEILLLANKIESKFKNPDSIYGDVYIGCAESDAMKYFARAAKNVLENYPDVHFNLYSGNIEDICSRLDNGLLDFYITLQSVDVSKYDSIKLPESDAWGILLRRDDPLAAKKFFTLEDLQSLPLILSREGMREEYPKLFGSALEKFRVVATYNLIFNAAIMAREGVGYPISIDKLINDAELCFRPLKPELKSALKFIWRRDRLLTPQAKILLDAMKRTLPNEQ
ncbi:MAG: LysR family transcriptional regulator [Selenomonadaceae bacterium]|nr:LysR family transcriptional regulator [Selenomonadaceae bacterium]